MASASLNKKHSNCSRKRSFRRRFQPWERRVNACTSSILSCRTVSRFLKIVDDIAPGSHPSGTPARRMPAQTRSRPARKIGLSLDWLTSTRRMAKLGSRRKSGLCSRSCGIQRAEQAQGCREPEIAGRKVAVGLNASA